MLNMVTIHAFPFILLSIDLILNQFDFRRRRILFVLVVGIAYLAINLAFTKLAHPVYPPIDWAS